GANRFSTATRRAPTKTPRWWPQTLTQQSRRRRQSSTRESALGRIQELWQSKDEKTKVKVLELCLAYQFGKPVQPVVDEEPAPPMEINIPLIVSGFMSPTA